jgi:hypothetical protein
MNVEIGTEAEQFLYWEYLFRILGIVSLLCSRINSFPTTTSIKYRKSYIYSSTSEV